MPSSVQTLDGLLLLMLLLLLMEIPLYNNKSRYVHYEIYGIGFFKRPLAKYTQLLRRKSCPKDKQNNQDYETSWI